MKKYNRMLIIVSALLLSALSLGTFFSGKDGFSENENRYLTKLPVLSAAAVTDGRFAAQSENYLADHIPGREIFIKAKTEVEFLLGITDINGTYLCKDNRLVQQITNQDFNFTTYENNLRQIKKLQQQCEAQGIALELMAVPTAQYVYREQLPSHALCFDEEKAFVMGKSMLKEHFIDLRETLSSQAEKPDRDVFFKTDHHWTGYGAFLAYRQYCSALGKSDFKGSYSRQNPQTLTDDFRGTLYSRVLLSRFGQDTIETPFAAVAADYTVTIEGKIYDSLYFKEFLQKKDKYAVFFGGNYARVDLKVQPRRKGPAQKEKKLLIIKDSFANSFVPYLLQDFSEITMVDKRYFQGSISNLAASFDRVLVLYGISDLAERNLHLQQNLLQ